MSRMNSPEDLLGRRRKTSERQLPAAVVAESLMDGPQLHYFGPRPLLPRRRNGSRDCRGRRSCLSCLEKLPSDCGWMDGYALVSCVRPHAVVSPQYFVRIHVAFVAAPDRYPFLSNMIQDPVRVDLFISPWSSRVKHNVKVGRVRNGGHRATVDLEAKAYEVWHLGCKVYDDTGK